jgi:predicted amidohydrolase
MLVELRNATDVFQLASILLKFCRDNRAAYRELVDQNPNLIVREFDIAREAHELFSDLEAEPDLRTEELDTLLSLLEPADAEVVLRARAIGKALDIALWAHFVGRVRDEGTIDPHVVNAVYMVPAVRWTDYFSRPTTNPDAVPPLQADHFPTLRIGPLLSASVRVVLSYEACHCLDAVDLLDEFRVATLHPNTTINEFHWDEYLPEARFFNVAPRNPEDQHLRVAALIGAAAEEGASIIVLPELSTTEPMMDALAATVSESESIDLAVLGSMHLHADDGRRSNTSEIVLRGHSHRLRTQKFEPHSIPGTNGQSTLREWLDPGNELVIWCASEMSIAVLVCRDFLNTDALDALAGCRPTFVLVPAMTDDMEIFARSASFLNSRAQSVVAVANGTLENVTGPAASIIVRPEAERSVSVYGEGDQRLDTPGLFLVDGSTGESLWVTVPVR